ncbi:hypothetical protein D9611_013503 [Ephemerocybe angulata]|uniref:RING-type domain-containing protein n=1 Tax=Ephemerocybe angulata TaxID=980116 RepID=A0A8H5F9Q6_9AGAR|nr:hypothetical protein D9611_013503 [Tulosesus angulatus]
MPHWRYLYISPRSGGDSQVKGMPRELTSSSSTAIRSTPYPPRTPSRRRNGVSDGPLAPSATAEPLSRFADNPHHRPPPSTPGPSRQSTPGPTAMLDLILKIRRDAQSKVPPTPEADPLDESQTSKQINTRDDNAMLDDIVDAVERAGSCEICTWFMRTPYVLECGHSFCGSCLRTVFERSLLQNLRPLGLDDHDTHDWDECQTIPVDDFGVERLIECVEEHKVEAIDVFTHPCPFCKTAVRRPPPINYALRESLNEAVVSFEGRFSPQWLNSVDTDNGEVNLERLFLTRKTCKKLGMKQLVH